MADSQQPHAATMSIEFPREEERILARWKEIDAFLRQVELVSFHITASSGQARVVDTC